MTMTTFSQDDDSLLAQISALVDGELSEPEFNELLIQMQARPELNEYWQRIQLQRSIYAKQRSVDPKISFLHIDLSDRIRQIISTDAPETVINNVLPFKTAVISQDKSVKPSLPIKNKFKILKQYNRTKAGWSVAASIALVALISVYQNQTPELSAVNMPELAQVTTKEPVSFEKNSSQEVVKVANEKSQQDAQLAVVEATPDISPVEEDVATALSLEYTSNMEEFRMTHSAQASLPWGAGLMPFGRMIETSQVALFEEGIVQPDDEE
ncbi:MAG: sigma-E factor negative regulatory protein [Pseudomonadota bacterium]